MNGPVLIPICSWFLTALSDFFNSLLGLKTALRGPKAEVCPFKIQEVVLVQTTKHRNGFSGSSTLP
jgi:hypothetical protein